MTQEFVTLPREVVEQAFAALKYEKDANNPLDWHHDKTMAALRAALEQPQNHIPGVRNMVLAGWKMVPVEPTEKMIDFGRSLSSFPDGVYRAMLAAAPQPPTTEQSSAVQPQANQPAMTPIAQRKLEDLVASGYTISGYSVYHERKHQHGFVTGAGLVGWWNPEGMEYPQPRGEQDWQASAAYDMIDRYLRNNLHDDDYSEYSAALDSIYTRQQPKREPLTNEQILGFGPGQEDAEWTYEDQLYFARAIENAHNIK